MTGADIEAIRTAIHELSWVGQIAVSAIILICAYALWSILAITWRLSELVLAKIDLTEAQTDLVRAQVDLTEAQTRQLEPDEDE